MKKHLEPLALAANITQSTHCRLDDVVMMFGYLFYQFSCFSDADKQPLREAVLQSIEARWAKADQDVFLAAVILNPELRTKPFRALNFLNILGITSLLSRLTTRFWPNDPVGTSSQLHSEIQEYLLNQGRFEGIEGYVIQDIEAANDQVREV